MMWTGLYVATAIYLQYHVIGLTPMAVGLSQSLAQQSGTVSRISSVTRQSALTLSDVYRRRICLRDTNVCSALEVDNFMRYINLLTYLWCKVTVTRWQYGRAVSPTGARSAATYSSSKARSRRHWGAVWLHATLTAVMAPCRHLTVTSLLPPWQLLLSPSYGGLRSTRHRHCHWL